jgi:hypothetical protein
VASCGDFDLGDHRDQKIVVLDSVSTEDPGQNSVIGVSAAIRSYLIARGWSQAKAVGSVVSLGIPETSYH